MSTIRDRILYSKEAWSNEGLVELDKNGGEILLENVANVIAEKGDNTWIVNCSYEMTGTTKGCGDKSMKFSEIEPTSRRIGAAFDTAGLGKGDVVHFLMPNNTLYHTMVVGAMLCDAVISLSDPKLSEANLKKQLGSTNVKIIVCYDGIASSVETALATLGLLGKVKVIVLEKSCPRDGEDGPTKKDGFIFFKDFLKMGGQEEKKNNSPAPSKDDVWMILWSSGTTGSPKGIQHTYEYFQHALRGLKTSKLFGRGDIMFGTCFFHIGGFISAFISYVAGCTINFFPLEDIEGSDSCQIMFEAISKYKPVLIMCGSHQLVSMANRGPDTKLDLASIMMAVPTGTTVPKDLVGKLKRFFPSLLAIVNLYTMTEIGLAVCYSLDASVVGPLLPGVTAKIVDPETGSLRGPGEVGVLYVKHVYGMKGYLNQPEEDAKFFADDGFFNTGDLCSYDNNGVLTFIGRHKELIKYKNYHLYPSEIERIINGLDDVVESVVFGRPDPECQEMVTAAVVKRAGSNLTEGDVVDRVDCQVDDFKRLRGGVIFLESLPRNPQGKIQRRKLADSH